jgi:hypothetical protein
MEAVPATVAFPNIDVFPPTVSNPRTFVSLRNREKVAHSTHGLADEAEKRKAFAVVLFAEMKEPVMSCNSSPMAFVKGSAEITLTDVD